MPHLLGRLISIKTHVYTFNWNFLIYEVFDKNFYHIKYKMYTDKEAIKIEMNKSKHANLLYLLLLISTTNVGSLDSMVILEIFSLICP